LFRLACESRSSGSLDAISEIVGLLLLLLITVGAGVIVYSYSASLVGNSEARQNTAQSNLVTLDLISFNMTTSGSQYPYVKLNVSNSQNSATGAPFQQLVTINPSLYSSLEASDLGNIRFFGTLSAGFFSNPINSWLEYTSSSPANRATSASFWLDLQSGIPALSSIAIYMVFNGSSNEFDGSIAGEAPQLSASYGAFDNGANVFDLYGGKSWSNFTFQSGAWSTVNGSLQQTSASASGGTVGGPAALIEGTQYSVSGYYVLETAFSYSAQSDSRVGIIADATPVGSPGSGTADTYGYRFIGEQSSNGPGFISFLNDWVAWVANGQYQGTTSTEYSMQITDAGGSWSGNLYSGDSVEGSAVASLAATLYSTGNDQGNSAGYVGISASYYNGGSVVSNPVNVHWFRMRRYAPSGRMPTVSTGSLVTSNSFGQRGADLYLRNPTGNPETIVAVYVFNETSNAFVTGEELNGSVVAQNSVIEIPILFVPDNGVSYIFTVVTQSGYEFSEASVARG